MSEPSPQLWVLIGIVGLIQLTLMIIAYVLLWRAPAERLTAPRWVWALICLVQFGPVLFLLFGRRPAPASAPAAGEGSDHLTDRVIDELYGARP